MQSEKKACSVLLEETITVIVQAMTEMKTLTRYERIGGEPTLERLVDSFYNRMDSLAEAKTIRAMHKPDLEQAKEDLKLFLAEWLGGPKLYTAGKGDLRLRTRHSHVAIGKAERDAWLLCMRQTMDELVADAQIRREVYGLIEKLADLLRNTSADSQ